MSNRFAIVVEGIESPDLVAEIEQTIRVALQDLALPGSWRIVVRPSRVGGRWGHIRGRFDDLQLVPPPNPVAMSADYGKTDTTGGLFWGIEAIYLMRRTTLGNMAWTVDTELANDWMKFNNWNSGNVGTASFMLGFMVTR